MATSFFGGLFFVGEFFHLAPTGPQPAVPYVYIMPLPTGFTQVGNSK